MENQPLLPVGFLFLDGACVEFRVESERKEPVLVAYGIRSDGSKMFLGEGPGHRGSFENWKTFLQEMIRRALKAPLLLITDGNPGVRSGSHRRSFH